MPYTPKQIEQLMTFQGYGNPKNPVWFLGMEEGGGGAENLDARLTFRSPVEDLRDAHIKNLGIGRYHLDTGISPRLQPTWRRMCELMLLRTGVEVTDIAKRNYQANLLGRMEAGTTFLAELMPIPARNLHEWSSYYEAQLGLTRQQYIHDHTEPRKNLLGALVNNHHPNLVIAHGLGHRKHFMGIFGDRAFVRDHNRFWYSFGDPLVVITDNLQRVNDVPALHEWIVNLEAENARLRGSRNSDLAAVVI